MDGNKAVGHRNSHRSTGGIKHISGSASKYELAASVKTKTENTTSGNDSSDSSVSSKKSVSKSCSIVVL